MQQIQKNNHFVPQSYLRGWSADGQQVYCYRTLVSHKDVPKWTLRPIRGIAYRQNLYTMIENGQEVDDFETWLSKEFDEPASEVLDKVKRGVRLTRSDWELLASFFACQDVRTPGFYFEWTERWNKTLPELMESEIKDSLRKVKLAQEKGVKLRPLKAESSLAKHFQVRISQDSIQAGVVVGRGLWLSAMKHILTGVASVLKQHKWSIVEAEEGAEWITSDHPALKLNYSTRGKYDFKGGWGRRGTDLILPLSPRHLLYTQVGKSRPSYCKFPQKVSVLIQRFLAERADRWIFSLKPNDGIAQLRRRLVDPEAVKGEEQAWALWHHQQRQAEEQGALG